MDRDPIFERNVEVRPIGYTLSVRLRPATVRRTVLYLLPWAAYLALPQGRAARVMFALASRISPLVRQKGL